MGKPSQGVLDFMSKYKVDSDEIWEVHGKTWVVKHKALERVAAEVGIVWERPAMLECNSGDGVAALCVFGKLGDRMEWSIGECLTVRADRAGGNYKVTGNQPGYVYAMAEKRAKDRVILKLLETSGALYSEAEADDFEKPAEELIKRSDGIEVLTVDAQRPIYSELQREIATLATVEECKRWTLAAKSRASRLSDSWRKMLNTEYLTHLRSLEKRDADEYIERKTG